MRTFTLLCAASALSISSVFSGEEPTPSNQQMVMQPLDDLDEDDDLIQLSKTSTARKQELMEWAYDRKGCENMQKQMAAKRGRIAKMDYRNKELNQLAYEEDKRWLSDLQITHTCLKKFRIKLY